MPIPPDDFPRPPLSGEALPGEDLAAGSSVPLVELDAYGLPLSETDYGPPRPAPGPVPAPIGDADNAAGGLLAMGEHFAELRRRLMLCALLFFPPVLAGMVFYKWLWELALLPARHAALMLGRELEAVLVLRPEGPASPLLMLVKWDVLIVLLLLAPLWIYQVWMFLAPGLLATERRAMRRVLGSGSLLFVAGALVAYVWAVPLALAFLLPFNQSLAGVENQWSIDGYLDFMLMACAGFGVAFELPLAMWALARAGLLTTAWLRKFWRHALLAVFVVAAALTPPEPVTQLLMAGILIALGATGWKLVALGERQAAAALEDQ